MHSSERIRLRSLSRPDRKENGAHIAGECLRGCGRVICAPAVALVLSFSLALEKGWSAERKEKEKKPASKSEVAGNGRRHRPARSISLLEAVRLTLGRSPRIAIEEKRTEVSRGVALARSGPFDTRLQTTGSHGAQRQEILREPAQPVDEAAAAAPVILPVSDLATGLPVPGVGIIVPQAAPAEAEQEPRVFQQNSSDFDVGLRKQLRNGAEVATQAVYSRRNQEPGGPIFNVSELRLSLRVPVLRAFTPSEAASLERSARIDFAASLLTERHVIAETVFETARAYWVLRASQERLDLLRRSEAAAVSLQKFLRILIDADERARIEIYQVDARVFETSARRIAEEQTLFDARQRLALIIGLDETEILTAPFAAEPFPTTHGLGRVRARRDALIAEAFGRRADYLASLKGTESARVLLDAARRNLLPRMDFELRASYFGGEIGGEFENLTGAFTGNQTGVGLVGFLSLDWPLENREARGQLIRSGAEFDQAGIRSDDLRRNIVSGIIVSINALVNGYSQLRQANEAVEAYEDALEGERLKFEAGDATLIDLINTEERLTNALLSAVSAKQQIAENYARLRFESGTLLPGAGPEMILTDDTLVTVPTLPDEVPFPLLPDFKTHVPLQLR